MRAGTTLAAAGMLAACGEPPATTAPITFRGAISGTYVAASPGSCGPGVTTVSGYFGPDHQNDTADLTVTDTGVIVLTGYGARGTYSGQGVAFRPGSGWDIDATITNGLTRTIKVRGHLSC